MSDAEFENDSLPDLQSVSSDDYMPYLIDDDYKAEEVFNNQQLLISNNRSSGLSGAFTNSSIRYNCPCYNLFTDYHK